MATSSKFVIRAKDRSLEGFSKEEEGKWSGPFCFIQGADTQLGMIESYIEEKSDYGWDEEIRLTKQAVAAINKLSPRPKMFVVCGDLVHAWPGDKYREEQVADYKSLLSELHPDIALVCVCGNHDIGNTPTPATVQRYREDFGDDYFSFWVGGVKCIVLNSQFYEDASLTLDLKAEQDAWLEGELSKAETHGCQHLLVFQHIPWFLAQPDEEKEYFNIDVDTRKTMLDKFKKAGVRTIFCGHYHRNAGGFYGDMELVVTSAVGAQLGEDLSGFRIVSVNEDSVKHKYYELAKVPEKIVLG